MCGICGIFTVDTQAGQPEFTQAVEAMTALIHRRGPDDAGQWCDSRGHAQLGFRRLAILDLSSAGAQPMISSDGRSALVFNGELYNFREIRQELESHGVYFRSRSDTEVVLEALNLWGHEAIQRFNGMFAIAWYNLESRELTLVRDHAGIKPLYYFLAPGKSGIAFASQFNCLLHTPWGDPGDVRLDVLHLYLRLHHVPAPYGLLENTYQLQPGQYLVMRADGSHSVCTWWQLPRDAEPTLFGPTAVDELHGALSNAVKRQCIADVPVGVFLSGGIDSPLVTAVAREYVGSELKAFTVSNPGWWQDESDAANSYARHLGVVHRLRSISDIDLSQVVLDVAQAQSEPFADFSTIPTLMVSRAARDEITVALSGDGGDELFWGYERPLSLLRNGTDFRWPWLVRLGLYGLGKFGLIQKRSGAIAARSPADYYFGVNSRLSGENLSSLAPALDAFPQEFDLYAFDKYTSLRQLANYSRYVEFYGQLQRCLKKVDMASMYNSLEVRVPLLDREVIEVSLHLDPFEAMRGHTRKAVLRDLLERYVPKDSIPTAKRGFAVPLGNWLTTSLRPLVEDRLLNNRGLFPDGLFDRKYLAEYWQEHLLGQADRKWGIWTLLMLQMWADYHLKKSVMSNVTTATSLSEKRELH